MADWTHYATMQEPDPDEKTRYRRQLSYFAEHAPNTPVDPSYPQLGNDNRAWGVPAHMWPPTDCVEYVIGQFKRFINVQQNYHVKPEQWFMLISTCLAHFAWLYTREGAEWLLGLYGVEEIEPHPGYTYVYLDPGTGKPAKVFPVESPDLKINLRIFMRTTPVHGPAIASEAGRTITESPRAMERIEVMKKFLADRRSPVAPSSEPMSWSTASLYRQVSEWIYHWLVEPNADQTFPFPKLDRMSGPDWARKSVKPDGTPRFNSLAKVAEFGKRAYRIEVMRRNDASPARVFWCGPQNMSHPPVVDVVRSEGLPESAIKDRYGCMSCGAIRCCTVVIGTGQRVCRHCYGIQLEKDERPSLDWCLYRECKACPSFLDSHDRLVQLVNKLNSDVSTPVNRHRQA